jgi:hypothetical protein
MRQVRNSPTCLHHPHSAPAGCSQILTCLVVRWAISWLFSPTRPKLRFACWMWADAGPAARRLRLELRLDASLSALLEVLQPAAARHAWGRNARDGGGAAAAAPPGWSSQADPCWRGRASPHHVAGSQLPITGSRESPGERPGTGLGPCAERAGDGKRTSGTVPGAVGAAAAAVAGALLGLSASEAAGLLVRLSPDQREVAGAALGVYVATCQVRPLVDRGTPGCGSYLSSWFSWL